MDMSQLEVLVAVAQERGFSRAAARLHRTQPAVSQAVRKLEDLVGEPLVDRSSKDGTLTAAGRVLFDYAQQMLALRVEAGRTIRELNDLRRGRVSIAANEYTVVYLLPIIKEFRARYPEVMVEVKRDLASRIPAVVLGREAEIGVVTYLPANPALKSVLGTKDELALIVAPGHPLAGRKEVSVRELGVESFIAHNVKSPYRQKVVAAFERSRTPLNITVEMPSLEAIKRLVAMGSGVALVPRLAAKNEIERGEVAALTVREMRLERRVNLIYRREAVLSHAARAFLAVAKAAK